MIESTLRKRAVVLALVLAPITGLLAQDRSLAVPVGSRVRVELRGARAVTGTVVDWRADTVVLAAEEPEDARGDTVSVSLAGVQGFRVVESPALWRHTTDTDIEFYFAVTNLPQRSSDDSLIVESYRTIILVAAQDRFEGLDPVTGAVVWSRPDLEKLTRSNVDLSWGDGVLTRGDTLQVLDLASGTTRWNTQMLPLAVARGWLPVTRDQMLVYGLDEDSTPTLLAVERISGTVQWRQTGLFTAEPEVFKSDGVSYLLGHQAPLMPDDTTMILYLSEDGPMALDARTGSVRWRVPSLAGVKVPKPKDGYARMIVRRGVLFVPTGKQLLALHTADGSNAWSTARTFSKPTTWMSPTDRGLIILADGRLDLLDFATGASVWREPFKLKNNGRFRVSGDTVFVTADARFLAVSLADGSAHTIGSVKFKEGEKPTSFLLLPEGYVLVSWHNVARLDSAGAQAYQAVYRSPGLSFGEQLTSGPIFRGPLRPVTRLSGSRVYFFTGDADPEGREGFSVVEFNAATGREDARIWLDKRSPLYLPHPESGSIYALRDDREITAYKFVARTALTHAAFNGHYTLVAQLLEMGADVNAANDQGWTALHAAASKGEGEVVSLLLSGGAEVDALRTPHWTPLHYAARNGHIEVVRRLLTGGADPNAVAYVDDEPWLPWMLAARNGHGEIVALLRDAGSEYNDAVDRLLIAWHHASRDEVDDAIAAHQAAFALDSTLSTFPGASQAVCYRASLQGRAADVLDACDRAVRDAQEANQRAAWFARGIARALTGDAAGAITDLEAVAEREAESESAGGRYDSVPAWIAALRAGNNPFTSEVLARLAEPAGR